LGVRESQPLAPSERGNASVPRIILGAVWDSETTQKNARIELARKRGISVLFVGLKRQKLCNFIGGLFTTRDINQKQRIGKIDRL